MPPTIKVLYRPQHLTTPVLPATPAEFAAVVDAMAADDDFMHSYATVHIETSRGLEAMLGLGVFGAKGVGAILYQGDLGEFYTKGDRPVERDVFYSDFGNARFFPPDSEIGLAPLKAALEALFLDGRELPAAVEWQQWVDTEH